MNKSNDSKRSTAEQAVISQYGEDAKNRPDFNDLVEQQLKNTGSSTNA